MAKSRAMMIQGAAGAVLILAAFGCGASQQHPAMEQQAATTETVPESSVGAPECVDEQDQQATCLSDSDCCPNFVCGRDPERNPRENYCIFGG